MMGSLPAPLVLLLMVNVPLLMARPAGPWVVEPITIPRPAPATVVDPKMVSNGTAGDSAAGSKTATALTPSLPMNNRSLEKVDPYAGAVPASQLVPSVHVEFVVPFHVKSAAKLLRGAKTTITADEVMTSWRGDAKNLGFMGCGGWICQVDGL
jgi:hypothetical protein